MKRSIEALALFGRTWSNAPFKLLRLLRAIPDEGLLNMPIIVPLVVGLPVGLAASALGIHSVPTYLPLIPVMATLAFAAWRHQNWFYAVPAGIGVALGTPLAAWYAGGGPPGRVVVGAAWGLLIHSWCLIAIAVALGIIAFLRWTAGYIEAREQRAQQKRDEDAGSGATLPVARVVAWPGRDLEV